MLATSIQLIGILICLVIGVAITYAIAYFACKRAIRDTLQKNQAVQAPREPNITK